MYTTITDDELITLIRQNNAQAYDLLTNRYWVFLCQWLDKILYKNTDYYEREDAFQCGWMMLLSCIDNYQSEKGLFYTYAKTCVERRLMLFVSQYAQRVNTIGYYPLDESAQNEIVSLRLASLSSADNMHNPVRCYHLKEEVSDIMSRSNLTTLEKRVFLARMTDMSYAEIAEALNITLKKVEYTLSCVKRKAQEKRPGMPVSL